jgi:DNA-binding transcriptional LysR family regulator
MSNETTMNGLTIHQLLCFDAVVTEGSFQAAAAKLHRTHTTVFAAVKNLETQLGLNLFDRDGYRVQLTDAGRTFHERTRIFLHELNLLHSHAEHIAKGVESELHVVIGDVCPVPEILSLLRRFFKDRPRTRLHLHFEALAGPWERLFDGEADLIFHHIDKSDPRFEFIDVCAVHIQPVVAPNFLAFPITDAVTPEHMREYVQCVIRDTARHSTTPNYFLIEGSRRCTVSDQWMKKEVILQGMGWGHMPTFMIADELHDGRLLPLASKHFPGGQAQIVAARRRDDPHGPVATELWCYIEAEAPALNKAIEML